MHNKGLDICPQKEPGYLGLTQYLQCIKKKKARKEERERKTQKEGERKEGWKGKKKEEKNGFLPTVVLSTQVKDTWIQI